MDECTTRNSYQLEPATPTVDETDTPVGDTTDNDVKSRKHKSSIPALVDNKRKHLERSLSAVQRDKILINEAKEDAMF